MPKNKEDLISEFAEQCPLYENFADRVSRIISDLLKTQKINFVIIENRAKTVESFRSKLDDPKYLDEPMRDLAGVRVVGYVQSDVKKIEKIIRKHFKVDLIHSKDKTKELGIDRVGYMGIHLICTLSGTRVKLPEYKKFKDLVVEIQIKTILQHAWAAIEHDRNYKYKTNSEEVQRELNLIAGRLETIDNDFEQITKRIDKTEIAIGEKTEKGKLKELEITPLSVKQYIIKKYSENLLFKHFYGFDHTGMREIEEIKYFGINTLEEFNKIIPSNIVEIISSGSNTKTNNVSSIIMIILLIKFGDRYYDIIKSTRQITKDMFDDALKKYVKI